MLENLAANHKRSGLEASFCVFDSANGKRNIDARGRGPLLRLFDDVRRNIASPDPPAGSSQPNRQLSFTAPDLQDIRGIRSHCRTVIKGSKEALHEMTRNGIARVVFVVVIPGRLNRVVLHFRCPGVSTNLFVKRYRVYLRMEMSYYLHGR